ncbi:MAG: IS5 family transposase [Thaumarchaeota archaeon]|jgi:hypothetical protein|nr:IS5 family transposase [Nitrososphaerota archaeon]
MTLLAYIHVLFHLPFRQEEGFVRALSKYVHNLKVPDFRTIWWRTNRLDINLESIDTDQPIVVAIDSTGIKVSNYGDWIRKKWKVKRGFLKVHLAVDVNSKEAVSMTVTEEDVSDGSQAKDLVNGAVSKNNIERLYGDGAYDSRGIFNFLAEKGIDPAIKVRRNSSMRAKGSQARKAAVIAQLDDFDKWKNEKGYGKRWAVEGAYSSIKRTFGEYVSARKFVNMTREMVIKVSLYNMFMRMTHDEV